MGDRLKGKVALVTGSGQGIGRAIAMGLASEGAKVVTNNRKPKSTDVTNLVGYSLDSLNKDRQSKLDKSLQELGGDAESTAAEIKKLGGEAIPFYGDVADFKVAGKFIQTAVDKWGSVDILVNNAGTFRYANIWDMSEEVWDTVTLGKPKSYFNCTRHAVPYMMKNKWGRIINTTSGAWLGGAGQNSNYCAANGGVVSFTSAIAKELVDYGITANAFCPEALTRATVTILARFEKMEEATGQTNDRRVKMFESHQLPEHIAPFLTYLATDEAADITGTVFHLGGERIGIYQQPIIVNEINKKTGGMWTVDELVKSVPKDLLKGYKNPAKQPMLGAKK